MYLAMTGSTQSSNVIRLNHKMLEYLSEYHNKEISPPKLADPEDRPTDLLRHSVSGLTRQGSNDYELLRGFGGNAHDGSESFLTPLPEGRDEEEGEGDGKEEVKNGEDDDGGDNSYHQHPLTKRRSSRRKSEPKSIRDRALSSNSITSETSMSEASENSISSNTSSNISPMEKEWYDSQSVEMTALDHDQDQDPISSPTSPTSHQSSAPHETS